jgi:hypothetical protein
MARTRGALDKNKPSPFVLSEAHEIRFPIDLKVHLDPPKNSHGLHGFSRIELGPCSSVSIRGLTVLLLVFDVYVLSVNDAFVFLLGLTIAAGIART